jgi:hypothetical protein
MYLGESAVLRTRLFFDVGTDKLESLRIKEFIRSVLMKNAG